MSKDERRQKREKKTRKIYIKDTVTNIVLKRQICCSLVGYTASGEICLEYGLFGFSNFAY